MANIKIVRYLALQNRQEECLNKVYEIRKFGQEECLTNEVLFYEVQALKILGKYGEAIKKGESLWSKEVSPKVLLLLVECYYLNVQEQDAIYTLREGIKKGIKNVEVYQMYAEYNKRINISESEKYVKKALIQSDNDPDVMMWAMNFFYSIGKSNSASELLIKLQALDKVNNFKTLTFKETKELLDKIEIENKKRFEMYTKCQFSYHILFDHYGRASYTLYCQQLWTNNINYIMGKQLLLTSFGGHKSSITEMKKTLGKDIIVDFSSLIHLKHFDILDEIKSCWNSLVISGNISNIIASEQNKCLPSQPDVLKANKKMRETWKRGGLNYIELPSQDELNKWSQSGITLADIIPYELAKKNHLVLVSDNFISDLLEESDKITDEMRNNSISPYELLVVLEKRKDISSKLKEKYRGNKEVREESELMEMLINYDGKLSILVDENFLREIFEMDGVAIISQKCNIYAISNVFDNSEREMKQVEVAKIACNFLDDLKNDIQEYKEAGDINYYGGGVNEYKKEHGICTNDLLDLFYYASSTKSILVCDDRWINSYNNLNECSIYSTTDIVELLHEQKIISDEKYINIITQMFNEGYAYIVPPLEYVKLLLERVPDGKNVCQEIPEELYVMCDYLVYITASENKLDDEMVHQGVIPESSAYMYNLQRVLIKLMKYIWCTEKEELWKCQVSDWLLANFSVFSYRTVLNESADSGNQKYYESELANFLFSGFCEILGSLYRKQYYNWLFNWFGKNSQWETGLKDRLIQSLADIICEVYRQEKGNLYKNIGIGMLVLTVTDDMPEYYRKLIRKHILIAPIIEKVEGNFIHLGEKDFIPRKDFYQWIEDAMKRGIRDSVIRIKDSTEKEYIITFLVNELFHQGFKIEYSDENGNKKSYYVRIDHAMLLCQDVLLRTKGLLALSNFITDSDMKEYQKKIKSKNWSEIVDKIVSKIKTREDYIVYIIRYMLENEIQMFSIDDLFPDNLIEKIIVNNSKADLLKRGNQWFQFNENNISGIFVQLVIYIYNYLKSNKRFMSFMEEDFLMVSYYFADIILVQILNLNENNRLKNSLQEILDRLLQLNESIKFPEIYQNNVISKEEKNDIEQEITEYFRAFNLQEANSDEFVEICKQMYFYEGENLKKYLFIIKQWILKNWKKGKKEKDEERELLSVMEYYVYVVNKKTPDQTINSYLELWEEVISSGAHIELSRSTMYALRRCVTSFSFEQGIRMRKIIEKISLHAQ